MTRYQVCADLLEILFEDMLGARVDLCDNHHNRKLEPNSNPKLLLLSRH